MRNMRKGKSVNIAFFLTPKQNVASIFDDNSLRQGLEKIRHNGYTALPVTTRDNKYVGTVSEGDFLWYLVREGQDIEPIDIRDIEDVCVRDILREDKNPPVGITASIEELLTRSMSQNFIPVVDDRDMFIGIVTRRNIIKHFYANNAALGAEKPEKDTTA